MPNEKPLVTVDSVLFTYADQEIQVLLVKRALAPEIDKWALPGGIVDTDADEDLERTALRKLQEKTGVAPRYLDQLETRGSQSRDPRGWSITVVYTALIAKQDCQSHISSVADAQWVSLDNVSSMTLAFDHNELITSAAERLKQRALYSIAPGYALADKFTLSELQHLHELLIGKPLQKRSFRRRIDQAGLLIDTGKKRREHGRPATLYKLKEKSRNYTFLRNLES
ncbi:MAG: NUDIX domain-containing protein [Pseudomonadota bacterium]